MQDLSYEARPMSLFLPYRSYLTEFDTDDMLIVLFVPLMICEQAWAGGCNKGIGKSNDGLFILFSRPLGRAAVATADLEGLDILPARI
jgi:hypothetical protein